MITLSTSHIEEETALFLDSKTRKQLIVFEMNMNQYHILPKVRRNKKKYINGAEQVVASNRLERQFESSAPNKKAGVILKCNCTSI